jgi:hypothetical protein
MMWLKPIIHWGLLLIQLITALLAIRCWRKTMPIAWKVFIGIWVLTLFTETAGKVMGAYKVNNLWLYNCFFALFYPGIVLLYADVFAKSKIKLLAMAASTLLLTWAVLSLAFQNSLALNTFYNTAASAIIIAFALLYLSKLFLDKETVTPLGNDYYYWFSTGFIIYFAFTAVMFGMYTTALSSKVAWLPRFMFYTNHLITLVLHIFLWTGFRAFFKWMK